MLLFLTILGGVAMILHGVRSLRRGLDRLFGDRLGPWLQGLANRPMRAFTGGMGISVLVPSSTSISSLAVQSVQTYGISPKQMLVLVLGADIGLTVTVQLLSLHIEHLAPVLILVGVTLYQYTNEPKSRGTGQVFLSFGFLFMGITMIQQAAAGFDPHGDLALLLEIAEHHPFGLAGIAAFLSIVLQSSTATVGLVVALVGSNGTIFPMSSAVAAVVGANAGVAVTTLFMGWRETKSRRFALANLIAKVTVGVLVLSLLPWVVELLDRTPGSLMRHIANAHTAFNVIKAALVLPLVGVLARFCEVLVPDPLVKPKEIFGPMYISDAPIDSASLALGQSLREILRVSDIVRSMFNDLWKSMMNNDEAAVREVAERDDQVDLLDRDIQRFLSRLGSETLDADQSAEQMRQLRYLAELENVGDVIEKNLFELALKKMKLGMPFSTEAKKELDVFIRLISQNMVIADTAFHTRDSLLAQKLLRHKEAINRCAAELRDQHFTRLNRRQIDSHEASALYLDVVTNLRRINSHFSHVAYGILQQDDPRAITFPGMLDRGDEGHADIAELPVEPGESDPLTATVEHDVLVSDGLK